MASDWELLQQYAAGPAGANTQRTDQGAFAELARRHVDMVYAAAVRMLSGPGKGEDDVVQAVFLLMAQKAGRLARRAAKGGTLAGWLFEVTRYCCRDVRKEDRRRKKHEREAPMVNEGIGDRGVGYRGEENEALLSVLDEALGRLGRREREAILVRYLEGKTAAETGAVLGVSAEAVEKRLERGIGKLRAVFARKGFVLPAAGVVGVMMAESARAAPAAVAASAADVIGGAGGASVAAVSIAKGAAVMMKVAMVKIVAGAVCAVLLLGTGTAVIVNQIAGAQGTRVAPTVPTPATIAATTTKGTQQAGTTPTTGPETEEQIVALIKAWGGTIKREDGKPDGAVVEVNLTSSRGVTDAGLEHLKGLKKLQKLFLDFTEVSDTGLKHLKELTALQGLFLAETKVTDAGLKHLNGSTEIRWLNLKGTDVTDAGLEHLKGLRQLEMLYLEETKVSDAGLKLLKGLKQLNSLTLIGTNVTDKGVQDFHEALPECKIMH